MVPDAPQARAVRDHGAERPSEPVGHALAEPPEGGEDDFGGTRRPGVQHLEFRGEASRVERPADGFHPAERPVDELLPTETRMHAHHQREVDQAQVRENGVDRRLGIEGQPWPDAPSADRGERPRDVARRLDVNGEVGRPGVGVAVHPLLRPVDHQVNVERQPRRLA